MADVILNDRRTDDDREQNRQEKQNHRHGKLRRQGMRLFLRRIQALIAALLGENPQGLAHRGAIFLRLAETDDQGAHDIESGALGQIVVSLGAIRQVGQFGGEQRELFGEFRALRSDLVGDFRQRTFQSHAGLDADQKQIERIRPRAPDRQLSLADPISQVQ